MKKLFTMTLLAVAVLGIASLAATPGVQAKTGGGSCATCPAGTVCCMGCNGQFACCARSYAFCPECPAP